MSDLFWLTEPQMRRTELHLPVPRGKPRDRRLFSGGTRRVWMIRGDVTVLRSG